MLARYRRPFTDWLVPRLHRAPALRALGRRLLRRRIIRQPFHGGVICLDAVEQSWAWTGGIRLETWDRPIQDRLLALSRECPTMIDVGGNVGAMSLSVALRNPDITIVCLEPNARACALLRESVVLNRLGDRVTVREAVAGDADGAVGFEEGGSTTGHIVASGQVTKPSLDFARLVDESAASGRCLVKVDVEGYETLLLAVLKRVMSRHNVLLFVELHALGFNGFGNPAACGELLLDSGASLADADGRPVPSIEPWTDGLVTRQIEARWHRREPA